MTSRNPRKGKVNKSLLFFNMNLLQTQMFNLIPRRNPGKGKVSFRKSEKDNVTSRKQEKGKVTVYKTRKGKVTSRKR